MVGERGNNLCYFCGGQLRYGLATIPFVLGSNVVVIKQVPAEVCEQCGEPILRSEVAGVVDGVLKKARTSGFEISVINYEQLEVSVG